MDHIANDELGFTLRDQRTGHVPVRMVWKAVSTFEASNADVSMNESPFSAVKKKAETHDQHREMGRTDVK